MTRISRLSLRWKLPGIIAMILVAAVAALSALALQAARNASIELATVRLEHAARRVSTTASLNVSAFVRRLDSLSRSPALVEALRTPLAPLSDSVLRALRRIAPDSTVAIALVDRLGRSRGRDSLMHREKLPPGLGTVHRMTISRLQVRDQVPEYSIVSPVRDSGQIVGLVVQWRHVTRVTSSTNLISELIGDGAVLLIGNADGSTLTEMADTTRPPVVRDSAAAAQARTRHIQASAPIPGTPWAFFVEFPSDIVFRPTGVLPWQSLLLGLGVIALAILAGTLLSRGITTPLIDLTTAAESIAGGDLTPRTVAIERGDEVGRLSRSFRVMADSIRDSRGQLERRIEERTAELQHALESLHETQDELVRKERLAMLGQLSSSVGHELRNPLGVMSNAVYLLEHTLEPPLAPRVQDCLRMLRSQIHLSERIVADLLDSVRGRSPHRRRVHTAELVSEGIGRVTVPSGVRLDVHIAPGLPVMHVDPDQVGQILVNLLTNAVQAMDGRAGVVTVRASNSQRRIRIEVGDTGPGVPADLSEKIFEPLYTTKARGIGLGLAVSRSLAQANGGSLSVMNQPGGGAVFTLDLPLGEPA